MTWGILSLMKRLLLSIFAMVLLTGPSLWAQSSCPILPELRRLEVTDAPQRKADHILVDKTHRKLYLWSDGEVIRTYKISLGFSPEGHKQQEGDGRTPEGKYFITHKNSQSKFHLSLGISYPNKQDKKKAKELGLSPGGDIMIHGLPSDPNKKLLISAVHLVWDWTQGCIAVTDKEIEEIYSVVDVGTQIEVCP